MKIEKLMSVGLAAVLSFAFAMPVLAQGNEAKDYQAIKDERDKKKLKSMLEAFLTNYPKSMNRADVEYQLIPVYTTAKEYAEAIKLADTFAQTEDAADAKIKSQFFTMAMEAARQQAIEADKKQGNPNFAKMTEYGDRALAIDPANISVLGTMARAFAENLPKDAAAREVSLKKAASYADRSLKVTKPATMDDPAWQANRVRLHDTFALIYMGQGHVNEATAELNEILKITPADVTVQYRYGLANFAQLQQMVADMQALNEEAQKKKAQGDDVSAYADILEKRAKEFEIERDITLDAMAKVVALAGTGAPEQARTVLEKTYQQKNGSQDGLTAFVAGKKAEIEALTPLAPPSVTPRGGGPPAPAGTGSRGAAAGSGGTAARGGKQ